MDRKSMVAIKGVLEDKLLSVMEGNEEDHLDKIVVFSYLNNNTTHICKVGFKIVDHCMLHFTNLQDFCEAGPIQLS